ncbi:uncharacterized protein J4E84_006854 [Alternaria hordeiaustralica]|uniref:uncharacterized protein n=1 Tax=Alternaria hordeiaustralica TaxID=1187925 RepID=UPI0020C4183F|nr:uncharacterized protein J4E84_006854 [Alternaria hordeiaustralica]KAI4682952.1 hypothetical protein J4E84_006854 [Alternaria hordeiaustralica]
MADRDIHDDHEEPANARHHAGRHEILKPFIPSNGNLYKPDGWPLETFAERRTLADHVVREYITLRKLRPKTHSKSLLASHGKALDGLAAYLDEIKNMEASERSVGTMTEETDQEKGMSPLPHLPTEPELPPRSQSVTSPLDELESPRIQASGHIVKPPSASNKSFSAPPSSIVRVSNSNAKTGQAQSGNACAGQAKKRSSGRSLKRVLKGAIKKLGLRRDASR